MKSTYNVMFCTYIVRTLGIHMICPSLPSLRLGGAKVEIFLSTFAPLGSQEYPLFGGHEKGAHFWLSRSHKPAHCFNTMLEPPQSNSFRPSQLKSPIRQHAAAAAEHRCRPLCASGRGLPRALQEQELCRSSWWIKTPFWEKSANFFL
jgi:hypothetical protein